MPGIFYYVSGHGFGHAVRSAQVLAAIKRRAPDLPVWVRTTAPSHLFPPEAQVTSVRLDLGVVQEGSLHVRPAETLRQYAEIVVTEADRIQTEVAEARDRGISCVVSDIAPAAFAIARQLDVPGIAVANFCWHWIYEPYASRYKRYQRVIDHIREQEGMASCLLRLPFAWDFSCMPRAVDVPLIGRRAAIPRAEVRAALGFGETERAALLSFGGFGLDALHDQHLNQWPDWLFITTDPSRPPGRRANTLNVTNQEISYVDLLAATDAVVTKPGFGIVSDALTNRVPVLYSDRGDFREYGMLSRALRRYGRAKLIPRRELMTGNLGPYLDALLQLQHPWADLSIDGANVIADRTLALARAST